MESDGFQLGPDELSAMTAGLFRGEGAEGGDPLVNYTRGDGRLGVKCACTGAGARREREEMQVAKGKAADKIVRLLKLAVGLAGEACHDVCTKRECGTSSSKQLLDLLSVVPGTIAAVHAAKDGVGAGLERKVGVSRESATGKLADNGDEVGVPVHGLDRAEAETWQSCLFEDGADKSGEGARLNRLRS